MKGVIDNNLPVVLARRILALTPDADVTHVRELGVQHASDTELRARWKRDPVAWITRDEDFWIDTPEGWAVVWIACHNPRLEWIRDRVAPVIAQHLPNLRPGSRLLITESLVYFM